MACFFNDGDFGFWAGPMGFEWVGRGGGRV